MALRITNPDATSPPPRDPNQLKERKTFGVEIEFMVATLDRDVEDPHPQEGRTVRGFDEGGNFQVQIEERMYDHIAATLNAAGIPTVVDKGGSERTYSWTVTDDLSLYIAEDYGYKYVGVELVSPPYYFEDAALDKVKQVLSLLKSTYRITCNESCGVHVHIGDGLRGLEDNTLRLLFATIWTFEPQLSTLHPAHRVVDSAYSESLRNLSWLGFYLSVFGGFNQERGLENILRATTNAEICKLMENYRHSKANHAARTVYNIRNMKKPFLYKVKKTIEFRQHARTLHSLRIVNWITVCHGLVEFSDTLETARIEKFLRRHINESPEEYNVIQMLNDIGLSTQAEFYTSRLTYHPADELGNNRQENPRVPSPLK